jgi:hypothetical protein
MREPILAKQVTLHLDDESSELIDKYANENHTTRSTAIRLILHDYFRKRTKVKE